MTGCRIAIDAAACDRTGFCARIAPSVFLLDVDSASLMPEFEGDLEDVAEPVMSLLLEAEVTCPTDAIRVTTETETSDSG